MQLGRFDDMCAVLPDEERPEPIDGETPDVTGTFKGKTQLPWWIAGDYWLFQCETIATLLEADAYRRHDAFRAYCRDRGAKLAVVLPLDEGFSLNCVVQFSAYWRLAAFLILELKAGR